MDGDFASVGGDDLMDDGEAERLAELFRIALQRPPTPTDREFATGFLARYGKSLSGTPAGERPELAWAALARIVLASNEFLFVE